MAKNGSKGHGREGTVSLRSQFFNIVTSLWVKRDDASGKIVDDKTTGGKFKGVRVEKKKHRKSHK